MHGDGNGLYLLVDATGARRWIYKFQLNKRRREMGLGSLSEVGLADARAKAKEKAQLVARGVDPIEEQKTPASAANFGEAADALIETLKPGWRGRKTEAGWKRSLVTQAAKIRATPVDQVTTEAVLSVLRPIWSTRPESAAKLRLRIETVLDASRALGHIQGAWENPARWRNHLSVILPKRQKLTRGHHRAIPYGRVPAFMRDLRERKGMGALALEWTVLTVVRETMTLEATRKEIQGDDWVIPAERMKMEKPFRVPLSPACKAILAKVCPEGGDPEDLLFPSRTTGGVMSNNTMDAVLERMKVDATPHGFRSTFRDWAGDETDAPREIAEQCLAHEIGGEVERAYRRGDALEKRRELMVLWSAHCDGLTPSARAPSRPIAVRSHARSQPA
ncbi:tyrosine-type recombinase/integrase [Caulobacter sp. ErkDOM-E]|uniref:tyrosine-type recombinase/integrase n=1 Tax=Caulobacter sp. ErkDOM-E TaxID=3402778 RepID=UPI003AF66CBB